MSPVNKPTRFASAFLVALVIGVLGTVLFAIYPGRSNIRDANIDTYDSASLEYLQSLLAAQPDNDDLRLAVVEHQLKAGRYDKAQVTSKPLIEAGDFSLRLNWAILHINIGRYKASTPGSLTYLNTLEAVIHDLKFLQALPDDNLSLEQLDELALYWGELSYPHEAGHLYSRLAQRDQEHAYSWYKKAGQWFLAARDIEQSSHAWRRALEFANSQDQEDKSARQLLKIMRMGDNSKETLETAHKLVARYPEDMVLLSDAIDAALSENEPTTALKWVTKLASLKPLDEDIQKKLADTALAAGKLDEALVVYQAIAPHFPENQVMQHRITQLEEWTGNPENALDRYLKIAKHNANSDLDQEIIRLGLAIHDIPNTVKALKRENKRGNLDSKRMELLVKLLNDYLGKPYEAIDILKKWLDFSKDNHFLWQRLALMYHDTNQSDKALNTLNKARASYGLDADDAMLEARIHVDNWNFTKALAALKRVSHLASGDNTDFWRALAESGWKTVNLQSAGLAYNKLREATPGEEFDADSEQRLIDSLLYEDKLEEAADTVAQTWDKANDPSALFSVIQASHEERRPDIARQLLKLAGQRPELVESYPEYWLVRGDTSQNEDDLEKAYHAYLSALKIDPGSDETKASFLEVLIQRKDKNKLTTLLQEWQDDALLSDDLAKIYAVANIELGLLQNSLFWFKQYLESNPQDYLWLLSYADALEASNRQADAYKIRLYALTRLRPKLRDKINNNKKMHFSDSDLETLEAQQDLLGNNQNRQWLKRVISTKDTHALRAQDLELLIDWHESVKEPRYVQYWLLRAQMARLKTPFSRQLSAALKTNNNRKIGQILAKASSGDLGDTERIAALKNIGNNSEALALALNGINRGRPAGEALQETKSEAASLYEQLPQNYGIDLSTKKSGNLSFYQEKGELKRSFNDWSIKLGVGANQYRGHSSLFLRDLKHDYLFTLGLSHFGKRNKQKFEIGRIESSHNGGFTRAKFSNERQFTDNLKVKLSANYHDQRFESDYFRLLGVRDSLGISGTYTLTDRDSLSLEGKGLRYQTRWDDTLGYGAKLDGEFQHALLTGPSYELTTRYDISWTRNNLHSHTPRKLKKWLPQEKGVDSLLPDEYGYTGFGLGFSRGEPGGDYPQVGGFRYSFTAGAGYIWTEGRFGYDLEGGIAHSVLGSDELGLFTQYSRTQSTTGGTTKGINLKYKFFLGK